MSEIWRNEARKEGLRGVRTNEMRGHCDKYLSSFLVSRCSFEVFFRSAPGVPTKSAILASGIVIIAIHLDATHIQYIS